LVAKRVRKTSVILLCAIVSVFISCGKKGNKSNEPTTDCTIRYYLNDNLLRYVNFSIVDSLHLEEGELPYSVALLDTCVSDFWTNTIGPFYCFDSSLYQAIPPSTIRVVTCTRKLGVGSYKYCIRLTYNNQNIDAPCSMLVAQETNTTPSTKSFEPSFETQKNISTKKEMASFLNKAQKALQIWVEISN